jgi:hypothetical protein
MLTGPELLAKVKELGDVSKSELVRECGYLSIKKDGTERLNFTAFYEALLDAKGVKMTKAKGAGRSLTYKTKVQFNGKLQIGDGYLREMGLDSGAEFEIKLGKNNITLTHVAPVAA